mmetsp:Transcript_4173/g.16227  ORF Transcript_4173/g.16227 Transcript_4173/m.16227 type:complete len:204 (-) Transcript_4173:307-918(-)
MRLRDARPRTGSGCRAASRRRASILMTESARRTSSSPRTGPSPRPSPPSTGTRRRWPSGRTSRTAGSRTSCCRAFRWSCMGTIFVSACSRTAAARRRRSRRRCARTRTTRRRRRGAPSGSGSSGDLRRHGSLASRTESPRRSCWLRSPRASPASRTTSPCGGEAVLASVWRPSLQVAGRQRRPTRTAASIPSTPSTRRVAVRL